MPAQLSAIDRTTATRVVGTIRVDASAALAKAINDMVNRLYADAVDAAEKRLGRKITAEERWNLTQAVDGRVKRILTAFTRTYCAG